MNSYNEARQALDPAVGVPFNVLADSLGVPLPRDPRKRKAVGGDIAETLLEIARNSIPKADLQALGTEVKTISLNTLSRPREWTKVCAFNIDVAAAEPDFRRSTVFKKMRCILFVPIMKADNTRPDFWYLRPPFLWLPTEDQLDALEVDYRRIQDLAARRDWSRLGGRSGMLLTLNTSDTTTAGKEASQKRRAWWLTKDITNSICEQNLWPKQAVEARVAEVAPTRIGRFTRAGSGDD
jgi:DNA mismatch repair protein MutH